MITVIFLVFRRPPSSPLSATLMSYTTAFRYTICRGHARSTGRPYRPQYSIAPCPYRPAMQTPDSSAAPAAQFENGESILIIDFGSQVTQLIARRVREAGVYKIGRAHV